MGNHINMERLHAIVHGDVQGVGFRYFVQRKGQQLGLQGWVRNNDDGTVELVAEGTRQQLEQLKRALEEGHLSFWLEGERFRGGWTLQRTSNGPKPQWLIVKRRDDVHPRGVM